MQDAMLMQGLKAKYMSGTPEEKAQAAEQLNMLNGKVAQRAKYSSGRIGTEADGITPIYGTYSEETGLPPPKAQAKPQIEEGSISTVNGKSAKWIGGKWVPQ